MLLCEELAPLLLPVRLAGEGRRHRLGPRLVSGKWGSGKWGG